MERLVGIVVIGRNEGERLQNCLLSVLDQGDCVVYVDSGSSDGSVEYAQARGVETVELDMSIPFSAARARNSGFDRLKERFGDLDYIQFIDGDCTLHSDWIETGWAFLERNDEYAIVAGRRRERDPSSTVYNLLCDLEWDTPVGEAKACGGDFLIRREAFEEVGGFNPTVVAGEEPELCFRLREKNWRIYRIDHEMTSHDAAMTRFSQWWRRAKRTGHAYVQGLWMHAKTMKFYYVPEVLRTLFWSLLLPVFVLLLGMGISKFFYLLFFLYLYRLFRIFLRKKNQWNDPKAAAYYALFCVLASWPQLFGVLLFGWRRISNSGIKIIEHK